MRTATGSNCQTPNVFDLCLQGQSGVMNRNLTRSRTRYPEGFAPWVSMPPSGQRFQRVTSTVLPDSEATTHQLLSYRVPQGYDGVLLTITTLFTGSGFIEGSGDITWRVRNNLRYFKDLGSVQITMGDLEYPYSLEGGGYRLSENEYLRVYVVLGSGALSRLDPNGRIVVGVTGWIYPRRIY